MVRKEKLGRRENTNTSATLRLIVHNPLTNICTAQFSTFQPQGILVVKVFGGCRDNIDHKDFQR